MKLCQNAVFLPKPKHSNILQNVGMFRNGDMEIAYNFMHNSYKVLHNEAFGYIVEVGTIKPKEAMYDKCTHHDG